MSDKFIGALLYARVKEFANADFKSTWKELPSDVRDTWNEIATQVGIAKQFFSPEGIATVYPVTIIASRYQGSYEGGRYVAFHGYPHQIPDEATGSDIECLEYWRSDRSMLVGRGSTPDAAGADLYNRLEKAGEL